MRTIFFLLLLPFCSMSQTAPAPVVNSFPSLSISAHSRGWAMGNTGIAAAEGNQALESNIAKIASVQNFHQASISYLPWMRAVSNDSRFMHADYIASVGDASALGVAINYLDLGNVAIRDDNGATLGLYKSSEFNIGGSYALQLGANASLGATMRFIGSRYFSTATENKYSLCGDLGFCQFVNMGDGVRLQWGATVSNLGAAINLPATAGVGLAYIKHDEANNRWTISLDASRLLQDDWKGLRVSTGVEYGFDEQFFLRGGVNLENKAKGDRKYFSLGAGYKGFISDQSWALDIHYLIPFAIVSGVSPFQNAFGLTLSINIGNFQ